MSQFSAVDLYMLQRLEKEAAARATKSIKAGLKYAIAETTSRPKVVKIGGKVYRYQNTGEAQKTAGSRAVFKDERLQRVTIRAPHYIFKQHYGFEGTKKDGVNMRMKPTGVIDLALQKANVLETLATEIGNIRADQVIANMSFDVNLNRKFIQNN